MRGVCLRVQPLMLGDELVLPVCREAYTNCTVLEARPCYDVARLMFLDAER